MWIERSGGNMNVWCQCPTSLQRRFLPIRLCVLQGQGRSRGMDLPFFKRPPSFGSYCHSFFLPPLSPTYNPSTTTTTPPWRLPIATPSLAWATPRTACKLISLCLADRFPELAIPFWSLDAYASPPSPPPLSSNTI